jgi:hypothetical protein
MGDHATRPPIRIIVEFADECRITLSLRRVWVLLPAQLKTVEDLSAYLVENYIEGPLGASAHVQILLEVGNLHQTIPVKTGGSPWFKEASFVYLVSGFVGAGLEP